MPIKGEYQVNAGFQAASIYSGQVAPVLTGAPGAVANGSDVLLFSGQGRVSHIIPHASFLTLSGVQVNLYDASAPISGGPLATFGHIPLGGLAAGWGVSGQISPAGTPVVLNTPFSSGLCINSRSGQPGVTVVWANEAVNNRG